MEQYFRRDASAHRVETNLGTCFNRRKRFRQIDRAKLYGMGREEDGQWDRLKYRIALVDTN